MSTPGYAADTLYQVAKVTIQCLQIMFRLFLTMFYIKLGQIRDNSAS